MSAALDYQEAHLVKMANQIASSIPTRVDVPRQIAGHLRNFWTPAMRAQIEQIARTAPEDLAPEVHQALDELRAMEA